MFRVLYANTVTYLMHAMVYIRLDIAHFVSVVSRFMVRPGRKHLQGVKRIFRYIRRTNEIDIVQEKGKE